MINGEYSHGMFYAKGKLLLQRAYGIWDFFQKGIRDFSELFTPGFMGSQISRNVRGLKYF